MNKDELADQEKLDKTRQPQYVIVPEYLPGYYDQEEVDLFSYLMVLWKHRLLIILLPLLSLVAAWAFSKLQTPVYESQTVLMVAEVRGTFRGDANRIRTFVQDTFSYFETVIKSSAILDRILAADFQHPETGNPAKLTEIWGIQTPVADALKIRGRQALEGKITVVQEGKNRNVISITVKDQYPELSASIANQLTVAVQAYDLELKTADIRREIQFLETQLAEVGGRLAKRESQLQTFLRSNRGVLSREDLAIERERLQREYQAEDTNYRSLQQELQSLTIAEKQDAPMISVIEEAVPPLAPSSPRTGLNVALGGVVGLMLAVGLAFVMEFTTLAWQRRKASAEVRPDEPSGGEPPAGEVYPKRIQAGRR